jgi:NADH-quinone oxidoreductase subunit F
MLEILERICGGDGRGGDIELLSELSLQIKEGALCQLGVTAPNPVLTTIKYFRREYEEHIVNKKCPAKKCKPLLNYVIDAEKCAGCTLCAKNCPYGAVEGELKKPHSIAAEICVKCGLCAEACRFGAVALN